MDRGCVEHWHPRIGWVREEDRQLGAGEDESVDPVIAPQASEDLERSVARGVQENAVDELAEVPRRTIELDPSAPLGPFLASARINTDVIAVDTAGHTPGSISLVACLGAAWVLICGDAVYPRMDDPDGPAWRGMLRISRALADLPALRVLPAHDTTVLRAVDGDAWMGAAAMPVDSDHD